MNKNKQTPIEKAIDLIDGFLTQLDDIAERNKKQNSVEWYHYAVIILESKSDHMSIEEYTEKRKHLFEQAKAMHKEEIIKSWMATDNDLQKIRAEQYYNETFNNNEWKPTS